jgi:hypothetical protein
MTKARDLSKLLSTSNGKIAGSNLDVSFENISDTGTEGTKVASGTTAQRGSTTGQIRFNSTTGLAEYYTGTAFKAIDSPPTVLSIDVTEVDSQAGGNQTIVITGSGFNSGATVTFIGNSGTNFNASTVTIDSDTQITAVAPKSSFLNAQEPYGVKVENTSGLSATLASQINVDTSPSWNTASGSIGDVGEGSSVNVSATATDPDGDTVSYSETGGTILTTNSLTLNSSTGGITGTAPTVSGDTLLNFTLRATANSKNSDRAFSINILNADGSSASRALQYGSEVITAQGGSFTAGKYWLTGKSSLGLTAQQVYVDADGYMLVYRHAGTGGSFNSTYEIVGNNLGESAVGTLNSPTQGLTDSGSSTTAGSKGMARLSAEFCNSLGGDSASGQVTRMTVGGLTHYITDARIWWTADGADGYGTEGISAGTSYSGRRTYSGQPDTDRPIGTYDMFNSGGLISFYHGTNYSGGYRSDTGDWHLDTTIWVRQY